MPTLAPAPARTPAADRGVRMKTETPAPAEPTVRAILRDAAKPAVGRPPAKTAWLCGFAAAALLWASFDPLGWWPLAWVAPVPLCVLVRNRVRARWEVRALWACGFVGTAAQIQWMRLGDPAMYPAWLALSAYLGVYFPLFVLASRGLVYKGKVPFAVAVPVVWCGLELCRGHLMTGFGWNLLAHSQWRWTTLIQCADLGGVYTVSAVVAAGGGALALAVPGGVAKRLGLNGERTPTPPGSPRSGRRSASAVCWPRPCCTAPGGPPAAPSPPGRGWRWCRRTTPVPSAPTPGPRTNITWRPSNSPATRPLTGRTW